MGRNIYIQLMILQVLFPIDFTETVLDLVLRNYNISKNYMYFNYLIS